MALLLLFVPGPAHAQDAPAEWRDALARVVPGADRFTERGGDPPVFRAYRTDPATGREELVAYAFLTSDLPPVEIGYSGPIEVLVGLDLAGRVTGISVIRYTESLRGSRGDFLSRSGFQEQYAGKDITDAFLVRRDIEGVTGATITVAAMSRGVRNAARRVAMAYQLGAAAAASGAPPIDLGSAGLAELAGLTWSDMLLREIPQRLTVQDQGRMILELNLVYLRDPTFAEWMIGPRLLTDAVARAGDRAWRDHLLMIGVDGLSAGSLNPSRLSVVQDGDTMPVRPEQVLLFRPPREGVVGGELQYVRLVLLDEAVDMTRPFTYVLAPRPPMQGAATTEYPGMAERPAPEPTFEQVSLDAGALEFARDETLLARTLSTTSWPRVAALAALLALAATAFFAKRVWLRRATLVATVVYLGAVSKGFLSVSHLTSGIQVGWGVYVADLPLLLLVAFTVVTTLLWGRVFCGFLCPFGAIQDALERVVPRRFRFEPSARTHERGARIKYGVLAVVVVPALAGSDSSLFQYFEPFGTVFFPSRSLVLWTIAAAVLVASASVPRFYCRYLCPLGAALAIGSVLSPFRIGRVEQCSHCKVCEQQCPTRAIRGARVDFKECVRCNHCEIALAQRAGVCRHDMERIRPRLVQLTRSRP